MIDRFKRKLTILAENLYSKYGQEKETTGEYGGKGKFELPSDHIAAIQVPKGGSCCANCKWVDAKNHECNNSYYIQWNGGSKKLPDLPLDEICSDFYEPAGGALK